MTLLLLPGMDGSGRLFDDFIAALGPEFPAIVVRYPVDGPQDYPALTAIVRAALPVGKPYLLLAESFSGPIGIALAASAPPGLLGLILCCSFAANPRPWLGRLPLWRYLPPKAFPRRLLGFALLGRHANPKRQAALARALAPLAPTVLRARLDAVIAVDLSAALATLRLPILYLRGGEDRVVPRAAAELVRRCAPRAEIVELAAPHFLLQVAPVRAAAQVRRFFAGVPATQ